MTSENTTSDPSGTATSAALGRVRWRRLAVIIVPAAAIAFALMGLTAKGAIASNISGFLDLY